MIPNRPLNDRAQELYIEGFGDPGCDHCSTEWNGQLVGDAVRAHRLLLVSLDANVAQRPSRAEQHKPLLRILRKETDRSRLIDFPREQAPGTGHTPALKTTVGQVEPMIERR